MRLLGRLDFIAHRANFLMHPVVGVVEEDALRAMRPSAAEGAIRELEHMKQYSTAKAIPALDYAIKALKEKADREKE